MVTLQPNCNSKTTNYKEINKIRNNNLKKKAEEFNL